MAGREIEVEIIPSCFNVVVNPEARGRNKNFLIVMGALLLVQFIFVTFGGSPLSVEPLNAKTWLVCVILAFLVIPIDIIRKVIMGSSKESAKTSE